LLKYLIRTAFDVLKDEGIGGVIRETLKYLSIYGTPRKLIKCKWQKFKEPCVTVGILGSKMKLDLTKGGIHEDLFMNGFREPEATIVMQDILTPKMTVLDIGANIGYYALMEARRCKSVIAIEPDVNNYEHLTENIEINGYENIVTHRLAVGDKSGRIDFALSKVPNWHRVAVGGEKDVISVPAIRLDDFKDLPKIDLLRMDVEGYEYNILNGGRNFIMQDKPDMFIEVHRDLLKNFGHSARELFELLAIYGYSIYKSFVIAKPSYSGKIADLLDDKKAMHELTEKGMATHMFFRREKC